MQSKSILEMASEKQSPGVIEMLMGFDTLQQQQQQQPIQKHQRVLSANYLQKTASLHFALKRVRSRRCSSPMQVDVDSDEKDIAKVGMMTYLDCSCNAGHQNCVDVKQQSCVDFPYSYSYKALKSAKVVPLNSLQLSDSMFTVCSLQDLEDTSMNTRHRREMLKSPYSIYDVKEKTCRKMMQSQLTHKHIPLKPFKRRFSVDPSEQLKENIKSPEEEKLEVFPSELIPNKLNASKDIISSVTSLSANRKHADLQNSIKVNWIKTHRSLIRPRGRCGTNWHLMAEEDAKITPSKTTMLISECKASSIPSNSGPVCTKLDPAFSMVPETESVKASLSIEAKTKMANYKNIVDECNEVRELLRESSPCSDSGRLKDSEMRLSEQTHMFGNSSDGDFVSAKEGASVGTQIESDLCALDDIYQETSDLLSEDSVVTCHSHEPASPTKSEEASRRSPISVLESLTHGSVQSNMNIYMNGCSDLYDEMYSEGPGMTISSDEDDQEASANTNQDSVKLSDVSYLVTMLDEAYGHIDLNYPIDPLMFETLTKRYGSQVSWPRSEAKLLVDRIKLGLKDIINSRIGIQQISLPVKKRLSPDWTQQEIEDTLWMLLVSQDKESTKARETSSPSPSPVKVKKLNSKKVKNSNVMKCLNFKAIAGDLSYFELEDYMDEIIIDIEGWLIDELVSELVSAASF